MTNLDAMTRTSFLALGWLADNPWGWIAIILAGVVIALAIFVFALPWIVQPFLRAVLSLRYDLKAIGRENIPKAGPVLVLSNHLSWFDGFFLAATLPRKGTALVNSGTFALPVIGKLARRCGLIPVPYQGPKAQRAAIEACRKVLDEAGLLVIFPEAQLSRTGMTGAFYRGFEVILSKREQVVVVPVYLDNVWGSVASYWGGLFFKKWPKGWRRTIVISFGPPIDPPVTVFRARQAVLVSGVSARAALKTPAETPRLIDPAQPHFEHPTLGPLTVSTEDVHEPQFSLHQLGQKPGTIGHPLPGIAFRAVDDSGQVLSEEIEGTLQALVPGRGDWTSLERRGKIDRDGFITFADPIPAAS